MRKPIILYPELVYAAVCYLHSSSYGSAAGMVGLQSQYINHPLGRTFRLCTRRENGRERTERRMKNEIVFAISGRPLAFALDTLMKRTDKMQCFWHFAPRPHHRTPTPGGAPNQYQIYQIFMLMHLCKHTRQIWTSDLFFCSTSSKDF